MENKVLIGLVAIILVTGVFYLFNSEEKTKAVDIEEFGDFTPAKDHEVILIPIKVHILKDSLRDEENVKKTIEETNRIWSFAGIYFEAESIVRTDLTNRDITNAIRGDYSEILENENYADGNINLFFTHSLSGINGLAMWHINSGFVADITTVNDYRTTAHELGHLLGLSHVDPEEMLMARGRNGEVLEDWEIQIARNNALKFGSIS